METKICSMCKEEKQLIEFGKDNSTKDKLQHKCNKCRRESWNNWAYKKGIRRAMNKNKECASFLGVYIAEDVLSKIFKHVEKMPNNNPGFDFICNKGYKIDVKASTLRHLKRYPAWHFRIRGNNIADYFLCLGFDNREDLTPLKLWLIPKKELITKDSINITNSEKVLQKWERYELNDKLEQVISCCNILKGEA